MAGTALWQGFDHSWRHNPHRLNRFGSLLRNLTSHSNTVSTTVRGDYVSQMQVGDALFADTADTYAYAAHVQANNVGQDLHFVHGFISATLSGQTGTSTTRHLPPVHFNVPAGMVATVVMRGFEIDCTSFDQGLHTRGFGLQLLQPVQQGSDFSFQPALMIHPDRSPDPLHPGPESYAYLMRLHYTIIYADATQVRYTLASHSPAPINGRQEQANRVSLAVVGQDDAVFYRATIGVRGFRWHLLDFAGTQNDGRYLKRLLFYLDAATYDPQAGLMTCVANYWFTNEDTLPYDFNTSYQLDITMLQYNSSIAPSQRQLSNVVTSATGVEVVQPFTLGGYIAGTPRQPSPARQTLTHS